MEIKSFYYEDYEEKDKKRIIKEELLTNKAEEWARSFIGAKPQLSQAQIRRFYHDVKSLQARVKAEGFETNRPIIKMLKSKAAYACPQSYKGRKVPLEFRNFMEKCVDEIQKEEDFKAFCLVFEAVIGYFYGLGGI